jgi:PAS domain S-box-containing protein
MKSKETTQLNAELRRQAESKLSKLSKKTAQAPKTNADIQRLVQELQVHQIELEMQNDELLQARMQLESTLNMYIELYAFAPVGYFTLARDGTIRHCNLTGAKLMGVGLSGLIGRRFDIFISPESRPTFDIFLDKVFTSQNKEICDVVIEAKGPAPFWVHIIGACETSDDKVGSCYAIVSEITERKRTKRAVNVK